MNVNEIVSDIKKVRVRGVDQTRLEDVRSLRAALAFHRTDLSDAELRDHHLDEFLRKAADQLDDLDALGIRTALGIGGMSGSKTERRADFAALYDRTSETVRRQGNLEDRAFKALAVAILKLPPVASTVPTSSNLEASEAPPSESAAPATGHRRTTPATEPEVQIAENVDRVLRNDIDRVVVGRPPEGGKAYLRRGFDDEIEKVWANGGDRRVWLQGGPGMGKSYCARGLMDAAIVDKTEGREELLIWVDSADADSVAAALSQAADRMSLRRFMGGGREQDDMHGQARALLDELETCRWRWLIVLDNADADSLISSGMIPSGRNPNGRVLITTSRVAPIKDRGNVLTVGLFKRDEAETYVRDALDATDVMSPSTVTTPTSDASALARAVGFHPLALSIATATITTNDMDVTEWLEEFSVAGLDSAADSLDPGGYRHLIGATWQIALERASRGLSRGVVERAAAVAAVMDPDGHPTWLWRRDAVARWISGSAKPLDLHFGRPVVVERLIEYGVIEPKGRWRDGQLAMHQLAARAVRELVGAASLSEIAGILLDELSGEDASDDRYFTPVDVVIRSVTELLRVVDVSPSRLARGYLFLAELRSEMFENSEALAAYQSAYDVALGIPTDLEAGSVECLELVALFRLGRMQSSLGRGSDARVSFERALEISQRRAESDNEKAARGGLVGMWNVLNALGRPDEAAVNLSRALERQPPEPPGEDEYRVEWLANTGSLQASLGQDAEADQNLSRALDILDRITWGQQESAAARIAAELAPIQVRLGQLHDAEITQQRLVAALERLAVGGTRQARMQLASAQQTLARMIRNDPRRQPEATALYALAVEAMADLTEVSPGQAEHTAQILALMAQAENDLSNGRHADAVDSYGKATRIAELIADLGPEDRAASRPIRTLYAVAQVGGSAAEFARFSAESPSTDDLEEVLESVSAAARQVEQLVEESPDDDALKFVYAGALGNQGVIQIMLGQHDESESSVSRAVEILGPMMDHPSATLGLEELMLVFTLNIVQLGALQSASEQEEEAIATYSRLLPFVEHAPESAKALLAVGLSDLGDLLDQFGSSDQSVEVQLLAEDLLQVRDPDSR